VQSKPARHVWRIGTRGSQLALAQAHETRDRLMAAHGLSADAFEIVVIKTSGDRIQDRPLAEAGGKGLFTKEIEEALIAGTIDFSVNSTKDMPTVLPDGLAMTAYLPREDVRDALISDVAGRVEDLPPGARVGSAALRRRAQLLRLRPDIRPELLRGNVPSRLAKVRSGALDATFLAFAGLRRLGLAHEAGELLDLDAFLPAVGQGAIGLESRRDDDATSALLAAIHDRATGDCVAAERAFLKVLDGSCRTPIAGHARLVDGALVFRGEVLLPDGSESHAVTAEGRPESAAALGRDAGERLKARAGADFFIRMAAARAGG
jgi:hydroxymethylbilane synthase